MPRVVVPILVFLALVAIVSALDRPAPRADFTFINRGDVSTLDPAIISWQQDNRVARIVSEGLTRSDNFAHNFEATPATAESWTLSPDKRTYTFHIRAEARWSNGEPVRAQDFVFSWRRSMLPDLAGDYVNFYMLFEGAREFTSWRAQALKDFALAPHAEGDAQLLWDQTLAKFEQLVHLRALDDATLEVRLVRPVPYFLDLTAFPPMYPVYPPLVRTFESLDPRTGFLRSRPDWTKPPHCVTNGPFVLTTWRFKRDMRFEQNPHYWNNDALNIRSIAIPSVQDANASVLAFNSGAADWVSDVVPGYRGEMLARKQAFYDEHASEVAALRAQFPRDPIEVDRRLPPDPRATIHAFPAFGTYFYNCNCLPTLRDGRPNPLSDSRVRRALAMTIDKAAICDRIRRVGEPPATTLIPQGSIVGYESPTGLPHNADAARALLAEAGFPGGKGLPTIEVLFNKDGGHDVIAQAIAKDWERELGITTRLDQVEVKVFRERLKNGDYMVSRAAWFGDYGDPTTFLNINRTGDGNNDRKFSSATFDALLDEAETKADPHERLRTLAQAERVLVEDEVPLIPIFRYMELLLFDAHKVAGISSHPRMEQQLFRVDVLGDGVGADQPRLMHDGVGEGSFGGVKRLE